MTARRMGIETQKRGAAEALPALVASKDVQKVVGTLAAKYDMFVSEQFAADLIAFVDAMTPTPEDQEAMLHEPRG